MNFYKNIADKFVDTPAVHGIVKIDYLYRLEIRACNIDHTTQWIFCIGHNQLCLKAGFDEQCMCLAKRFKRIGVNSQVQIYGLPCITMNSQGRGTDYHAANLALR